MLYTELTLRAMQISYLAHSCKYDKGGAPYVFHPMHLAEQMDTEYEICVALLHDVVEDSPYTIDDLKTWFPHDVIRAVELLTRKEKQSYGGYISELADNMLARKVKIADLKHNLDESRFALDKTFNPKKFASLRKRYETALKTLEGGKC